MPRARLSRLLWLRLRADALLRALKDELFVLETDRLAGRLSEAEYAEHKAAFDVVLRRALARSEARPARLMNEAAGAAA